MDDRPWGAYNRAPLRAGFAHPVSRTAVEDELRSAGCAWTPFPRANGPSYGDCC
ncbi:hypothetical protein [Streptomyces sp. NPDC051183]|uniref:hypothetical protein n=1 Tax=Streptomyces sp. NPDC051183 TaxID=3155165 RepID=UPI003417B350